MFAYSLKMWGKSTGDASLEARGNLMLGILANTFDDYFLMTSRNQNQPSNFIANKVTGIVSLPYPWLPINLESQVYIDSRGPVPRSLPDSLFPHLARLSPSLLSAAIGKEGH